MRTTIRDVAEAAGVSAMAVSAVLNGSGSNVKVGAAKAEHIRKIAQEMRYQPNHLARSLRNQRTGMIAVVFQHFDRLGEQQPYYPQLLNGVMSALFPAEYSLALCPKLLIDGDAETISDGRFDGVLWCRPEFDGPSVEAIKRASVPVVMVHAPPGTVPGIPTFCADNESAMRSVVKHLRDLGHLKVAYVFQASNEKSFEGLARWTAFLAACLSCGIAPDMLIWDDVDNEIEIYKTSQAPHTALVCFSDYMAGLVLTACEKAGVSVPGQVSVVGFDSSSFCDQTTPKLTSVNQPVELMAFRATSHLLDIIRDNREGKPPAPTVSSIYDCGLDIRESTARPRTH